MQWGKGKRKEGKGKKRRQTQEGGRENKADRTIRQSCTGEKERRGRYREVLDQAGTVTFCCMLGGQGVAGDCVYTP